MPLPLKQLDEVTPERYNKIVVVPPVIKLQELSLTVASTLTLVVVAAVSVIVAGLFPSIFIDEIESGVLGVGDHAVVTLQYVQPVEELNSMLPATLPTAIP